MDLVYISSSIIPSREANSIHVMEMCQAFAQNGHRVTLIAPEVREHYEPRVDDVFRFYGVQNCFEFITFPATKSLGKVARFYYALSAANYVVKRRPDLVCGRNHYAIYLAALRGVRTTLDAHGELYKHGRIARIALKGLFGHRNFSHLTVNSRQLKELFAKHTGFDPERIYPAPNGASVSDPNLTVSNWPGRAEALQVGYVGHLYPGRGVDIIFAIAERLPDVDFHIVGGTEEDIRYWRQRVQLKNVFMHGYVKHAEVAAYRNRCDLLLAPYQRKVEVLGGGDTSAFMCPIKIIEYMESGKVIIASDMPAIRNVLNGENSLLVEGSDIDAWVAAIARCRSAALRSSIAAEAKRDFHDNYTWRKRAEKILVPLMGPASE